MLVRIGINGRRDARVARTGSLDVAVPARLRAAGRGAGRRLGVVWDAGGAWGSGGGLAEGHDTP
ncbi:MAG: hypothetical protein QOG46_1596 [Pseudonocardiales bacterium]|jgi:hypothetical protein|nr:hypothetical protein [Pseudonocardiales bacterium]